MPKKPRYAYRFASSCLVDSDPHPSTACCCVAFPLSSNAGRFPLAGPITWIPSLLKRLPCTGQSQLFSSWFQQTTPFICGHRAENLCTSPPSSLYTAIGVEVLGFSTPPLPLAKSSMSLMSLCRKRLYCALIWRSCATMPGRLETILLSLFGS